MANPSDPGLPTKMPDAKIKGKMKVKLTMIAEYFARGLSFKDVAKKVNLSESRLSHLLSEKDSFVNLEISRILSELFAENDRRLIDLYSKALQKLDNILSSSDEEKQFRAIDRIIKTFLARAAKNLVTIQQYFGIEQVGKEEPLTIEEIILQRARERGLLVSQEKDLRDYILRFRNARGLSELPDDCMKDIISKALAEPNLPSPTDHKDSSEITPKDSSDSPADSSSDELKAFAESIMK